MMKNGQQGEGGVRLNASSLRGGGYQQKERSRDNDGHCERDENRGTGSLSGGEQIKLKLREVEVPGQDVTDQIVTNSRVGARQN